MVDQWAIAQTIITGISVIAVPLGTYAIAEIGVLGPRFEIVKESTHGNNFSFSLRNVGLRTAKNLRVYDENGDLVSTFSYLAPNEARSIVSLASKDFAAIYKVVFSHYGNHSRDLLLYADEIALAGKAIAKSLLGNPKEVRLSEISSVFTMLKKEYIRGTTNINLYSYGNRISTLEFTNKLGNCHNLPGKDIAFKIYDSDFLEVVGFFIGIFGIPIEQDIRHNSKKIASFTWKVDSSQLRSLTSRGRITASIKNKKVAWIRLFADPAIKRFVSSAKKLKANNFEIISNSENYVTVKLSMHNCYYKINVPKKSILTEESTVYYYNRKDSLSRAIFSKSGEGLTIFGKGWIFASVEDGTAVDIHGKGERMFKIPVALGEKLNNVLLSS